MQPPQESSQRPSLPARTRRTRVAGRLVLVVGLTLLVGSAFWIMADKGGEVRFSADAEDTVALWTRWLPALLGILLVRLVPSDVKTWPADERTSLDIGAFRMQVVTLLTVAVIFAVGLRLIGGGEPAHTVTKLPLLVAMPLLMFWLLRRRGAVTDIRPSGWGPWSRYGPIIPVAGWLVAYSLVGVNPISYDELGPAVLAISMLGGFLLNSLLEEVFYRRWLQTRTEVLLGRWPAIVLVALLWAVWHIGIQSVGDLGTDLASALASHGVAGIFLGYLWSKYRLMWPIVVVHGAINSLATIAFWL